VSELILSHNLIQNIRSTSLAELTDLKALYFDYNNVNFVDPTSFEFMTQLEVFNFNHNLDLSLDYGLDFMNCNLFTISTSNLVFYLNFYFPNRGV